MERDEYDGSEPSKDTEMERRSGPEVLHKVDPAAPRGRGEAVYGETDIDPRREEQPSAHRATEDEHL